MARGRGWRGGGTAGGCERVRGKSLYLLEQYGSSRNCHWPDSILLTWFHFVERLFSIVFEVRGRVHVVFVREDSGSTKQYMYREIWNCRGGEGDWEIPYAMDGMVKASDEREYWQLLRKY